jgi:hypothetical protein
LASEAILRLVRKRLEEYKTSIVRTDFLGPGGGGSVAVKRYRVTGTSVLLQRVDMVEVVERSVFVVRTRAAENAFCRWHDGPLDRRDDPGRRIYCNTPVGRGLGYCREHRRSDRALYEYCMSLSGYKALEACRELDSRLKLEYGLYLLDSGHERPKVGVTRLFRLTERVAEQPHSVATLLGVFDSAYQARKAEITVSRELGLASERGAGRLRFGRDVAASIARVRSVALKAAKRLGLYWDESFLRVEPPEALGQARMSMPKDAEHLEVRVEGYWGGLLLLRDRRGVMLGVRDRALLHRSSALL